MLDVDNTVYDFVRIGFLYGIQYFFRLIWFLYGVQYKYLEGFWNWSWN